MRRQLERKRAARACYDVGGAFRLRGVCGVANPRAVGAGDAPVEVVWCERSAPDLVRGARRPRRETVAPRLRASSPGAGSSVSVHLGDGRTPSISSGTAGPVGMSGSCWPSSMCQSSMPTCGSSRVSDLRTSWV